MFIIQICMMYIVRNISSLQINTNEKLRFTCSNCDRLDILVQKEPISRRPSSKLKVDQLKYDNSHFQVRIHYSF